jgi:hypothetical protein
MESGYGERREIGRFVKVDFWKAKLAEKEAVETNYLVKTCRVAFESVVFSTSKG